MKFLNFFKLIKWYEYLYYAAIVTILLVLGIVFHSSWLIIINSLLGITTSFLLGKALWIGNVFGIMQFFFYTYIAFQNAYYGEIINSVLFSLPIYIASIITWTRHKQKGQVKINTKLSIKELSIATSAVFAISFGLYFMLRAFNTANLIISTIALSIDALRGYLRVRRSELNFLLSIVSRIMTFVMWLLIVIQGSLNYIPTVATYLIYLTIDIFGLIVWIKLKKKQNQPEVAIETTVEQEKIEQNETK